MNDAVLQAKGMFDYIKGIDHKIAKKRIMMGFLKMKASALTGQFLKR